MAQDKIPIHECEQAGVFRMIATSLDRIEKKVDKIGESKADKEDVKSLHDRIDIVDDSKADKTDLDRLNGRLWVIAGSIITILVSIVGYLLITYVFNNA